MVPVIGLIGGIGSGKSLIAKLLAERGARVISGDQLGHEALRQPDIKAKIAKHWDVLDEEGEVDRRRLGAIVFADPKERQELERLSFPWIERGIEQQIAAARQDPGVSLIVLDAAIMVETGWSRFCDKIVFIDVPREVRLQRLAEQRRWGEKEVAARELAQLSVTEKRRRADGVLDNSGTPEQTAQQVDRLLRQWGFSHETH